MSDVTPVARSDWEQKLHATLTLFGHRNWIVVADAAYPAQSKPGIETIVAGEGQLDVIRKVVDAIGVSIHIRASIFLDSELDFVPERDAPGIASYKRGLEILLAGSNPKRLPHEQIIRKLDQSAEIFRILIIKTELTIPYTSVFFELECGYWSAEAEQHLREAIQNAEIERTR
jgi:hypothetical protein